MAKDRAKNKGDLSFTNFNLEVEAVEGTFIYRNEPVTNVDSGNYDEYEIVGLGFAFRAVGTVVFDAASTEPVDSSGIAAVFDTETGQAEGTLTLHTGCTVAGTFSCQLVNLTAGAQQVAKVAIQGVATGQPTVTWDES